MDLETWRPVVGYEGRYEVSDIGRVRSVTREIPNAGTRGGGCTGGPPSDNVADSVRHGTQAGARKTHCKSGHEFTEENTRRSGNKRSCRKCHAKWEADRRGRLR